MSARGEIPPWYLVSPTSFSHFPSSFSVFLCPPLSTCNPSIKPLTGLSSSTVKSHALAFYWPKWKEGSHDITNHPGEAVLTSECKQHQANPQQISGEIVFPGITLSVGCAIPMVSTENIHMHNIIQTELVKGLYMHLKKYVSVCVCVCVRE